MASLKLHDVLKQDFEPTEPERKLIAATARGEICDLSGGKKIEKPPESAAEFGPDQVVRAAAVVALATGARADWPTTAKGVRLWGARIDGDLDFEGATLICPLGIFGCFIECTVNFYCAHSRGIHIHKSRLNVAGDIAIRGDGLVCDGPLFLRGSHISGKVRLLSARIGDDLVCSETRLEDESGSALNADRIETRGNIFLNQMFATGEVRLLGANIGGSLILNGACLENETGHAFHGQEMTVTRGFVFRNLKARPKGVVDLTRAKVETLVDDRYAWPEQGKLFIDGFEYDSIVGTGTPLDCKSRLDWLGRMPGDEYLPQPYEQLAKVLRQTGHETDARKIAMAKQEARLERGNLSLSHKIWLRITGLVVGYGYEPWRAIYWALPVLVLGWIVFWDASGYGAMRPAKERVYVDPCYRIEKTCPGWTEFKPLLGKDTIRLPADYPAFWPFLYSLDVFLPIVDLHQESYWLPNGDAPRGGFAHFYLWFHIAFGWILTGFAVAALTGIVKKD